jgi:hypothetical protein
VSSFAPFQGAKLQKNLHSTNSFLIFSNLQALLYASNPYYFPIFLWVRILFLSLHQNSIAGRGMHIAGRGMYIAGPAIQIARREMEKI